MSPGQKEQREVKELRSQTQGTFRVCSPALEKLLYKPILALDHGFIRVVDYMGDDAAVVQAARVSYGRGTKRVSEDRGLIRYLLRHKHTTPFEMCEIKYHVKLPVFVARQWIRHRTANVNEYSARYSILDKEFYIPDPSHLAAQSDDNRQGRGRVLQGNEAQMVLDLLREDASRNYTNYKEMLNEDELGNPVDGDRQGLARELGRMNLTLNIYTQWYWKTDLHNLMNFLSLRRDKHAQYEIRVYADLMMDTLRSWVPHTAEAFEEYNLGSVNFSRTALTVVRRLIKGENVTQETSGLSQREWRELLEDLHI